MIEFFASQANDFFEKWSYLGGCVLMALESMIAPVPSEVVMPPIGMQVAEGNMTLVGALVATSFGSMIGSWLSYAMGYWGGKPVVLKFGKYLLLNRHHLEWTEKWFHTHGGITIFVGRFIPVVRHLISIPAGVGKMPLLSFSLYTLVGATLWNGFLLWLGMKLQQNWEVILKYRQPLDIAVIVILFGFVAYFVWAHLLPARKRAAAEDETRKP